MTVDESALGDELDQVAQQEAAFRDRHAGDVRSMCGEVERLALRARMDADDALRHGRQYVALAEQQFGEADLGARISDIVHRDEPVDLRLDLIGQCVLGGAQIGEFGFAGRSSGTRCA